MIAERALSDSVWQAATRRQLQGSSAACAQLLQRVFPSAQVLRNALFVSAVFASAEAEAVREQLARAGIWMRRVEMEGGRTLLRFGLVEPGSVEWRRFQSALAAFETAGDQKFSITV